MEQWKEIYLQLMIVKLWIAWLLLKGNYSSKQDIVCTLLEGKIKKYIYIYPIINHNNNRTELTTNKCLSVW